MQKHGSTPYNELRKLGIAPSEIIDFSASVNPLPSPFDIFDPFKSVDFKNYPDRASVRFIDEISKCYGVDNSVVMACAGTTDAIYSLPDIFLQPLLLAPTYGDYEDAFHKSDITIQKMIFSFLISDGIESAVEKLKDINWDLLVIVNPNNPTGEYLEPDEIAVLLENFKDRTILIDEAYQEIGEDCSSALDLVNKFDNLVVLRSLTKSYGLPAVRCGWISSSKKLLDEFRNSLKPWQISSLDEALFIKVLENRHEYIKQWQKILIQKVLMLKKLKSAGVMVFSGRGPFFLIDVENASEVRMKLLEKYHLHVRDCTSFGLENYIRIIPGIEEVNNKLIASILQVLS